MCRTTPGKKGVNAIRTLPYGYVTTCAGLPLCCVNNRFLLRTLMCISYDSVKFYVAPYSVIKNIFIN